MAGLDSNLLDGLLAWEREACEAFVDVHYRGVYGFFAWLVRDREAAADLTQETFAAFWEGIGSLDRSAPPDLKDWLYGIARNRWRKRCRDARPCAALEEAADVPDERAGPEAAVLHGLEADEVARAVGDLPAEYREALVLRVFQDLTYRQVGEVLGISEGLARWRVHRARLWLCAALRSEWAPSEWK